MIVTTDASLKAPRCFKCDGLTKLCNSSKNVFTMMWHCGCCKTNFDYQTGTEIADKELTIGESYAYDRP